MDAWRELTKALRALQQMVIRDDYDALERSAARPAPIHRMIDAVDKHLTGKLNIDHAENTRELLEEGRTLVYLSDGGYSRLLLQYADPEQAVYGMDLGGATPRVRERYLALPKARRNSPAHVAALAPVAAGQLREQLRGTVAQTRQGVQAAQDVVALLRAGQRREAVRRYGKGFVDSAVLSLATEGRKVEALIPFAQAEMEAPMQQNPYARADDNRTRRNPAPLAITAKRDGNALRLRFEGTVNRVKVRGHTLSYMLGIDPPPDYTLVSQLLSVHKAGGRGEVSTSARHKVVQALVERLKQEARRGNPKESTVFSAIAYVAGQEPDVDDAYRGEGFVTVLRVQFTIDGQRLARMLGVQRRVLQRKLDKLTESQAIWALTEGKIGDAVLRSFKDDATAYIQGDVNEAAGEPGLFRATDVDVSWPEDTGYWEVGVYPESMSIVFDAEIDVIGDWTGRD